MTDLSFGHDAPAFPAPATPAITLRFFRMELAGYLRAPMAIFWSFIYPVVLFFLLNAIFGGGVSPWGPPLSYADYLISGLVVMTMISSSLIGFAVVLIEQRAQGQLQSFALMPFGKGPFYAGFVGARMLVLLGFLTGFMAVFSHFAPGATALGADRLALLALYLAGGMSVMFAAALLLANAIRRTATAHAVANMLNIPLIFLSDLFLPAVLMPEALFNVISRGPFFHYVNQLRAIQAGEAGLAAIAPQVAVMLAIGAGLMILAARRARWTA